MQDDRIDIYRRCTARYGSDFANNFHHYSEGLFLDASDWLTEGALAIDAGSYIGDNAFAMAGRVGDSGTVWTFEPDPRLWTQVAKRIGERPAGWNRIKLLNNALAAQPAITRFQIANELPGHSGLQVKQDYGREVTITEIAVVAYRLDDLLAEHRVDPARLALIKYDLEGGELHALQGSRNSIVAGQPLIMFECGAFGPYGVTQEDIVAFFDSVQYTIIDCFGLTIESADHLRQSIGWNLFAAPNSRPKAATFVRQIVANRMGAFLA